MYDSFHRIIVRHESKVIKEKNINKPLVPISSYQFFFQKNVAIEKAMELSCNAGVNKPRVKPKSLSFFEESLILNHFCTQLNTPKGIQKRMLYYVVTYFVIRGNKECYNLKYKDFTIGANQDGAANVT